MSACHVEEDAGQEASSEAGAVEQGTEAKYSQDRTCKAQAEGKADLEYGRFGEYVKQFFEVKARRSTHGSTRSSARRCWTMTVQAWWSKSPQARN